MLVSGFVGIGRPEKDSLTHAMRTVCGTGSTVKDGASEIQGDQRPEAARVPTEARVPMEAGFRPAFVGGCFASRRHPTCTVPAAP